MQPWAGHQAEGKAHGGRQEHAASEDVYWSLGSARIRPGAPSHGPAADRPGHGEAISFYPVIDNVIKKINFTIIQFAHLLGYDFDRFVS